jgi:hypothetical protein
MTHSEDLRTYLLTTLHEKKVLYEQMISDNREFEVVKSLFMEIKALHQQLLNLEKDTNMTLS